ncbi:MAG TPA: low-specificity L-threonine aldolase [Usitatibacteraceae bacterium]|nr:low-specificity L-threonine aldolase [Usitatibacteraceae bacterium]
MNRVLDFRSDTVTRPTPAMREAMFRAEVGDDVYGEDPTVNALEQAAADRLGFEAALYGVSGTQTNLLGLMAHCQRGEEVIVGQMAHTYRWEAGGMAVLGSIQPQPLENNADGTIDVERIEAAIKPDDSHCAVTRLVALENTFGGRVLPQDYVQRVRRLADRHGLAMHLDGARLFNAAVACAEQGTLTAAEAARQIAAPFDSVSICLSKGLGAPVGSLLLGSRPLIERARRLRKMIGGGMRQAGVVAAAGLYALDHHIERLATDHANAQRLAQGLQQAGAGQLDIEPAQTNMVWISVAEPVAARFAAHLAANGVLVQGTNRQRWVTHLDLEATDVDAALEVVRAFFCGNP